MKTRNEMDKKYMWDLTHIFKDEGEFSASLDEVQKLIPELSACEGKIGKSFENFKGTLEKLFEIFALSEKQGVYAYMCFSSDGSDPKAQETLGRAQSMQVKAMTAASFIEPEILTIPDDVLKDYMSREGMDIYSQYVDDIARAKAHTLDAKSEKLLAGVRDVSESPSDIYNTFCDVDMTFPEITDSKGNKYELTHGNFSVYRESTDRVLRENAFSTFFGVYKKYINTMASTYSANVKFDCYFANVKGYANALEAGLFGSNVPTDVYTSLCETMRKSLPSMRKYIDLRTKALGKEKIDMFDLYTPMVSDIEYSVKYEDAQKLVKKALKPLGEKYQSLLDEAFSNSWIDVYENKGKSTGAYSISTYSVHPYVLLNYTDTLDDAFTLAHELGHAMHSYFSCEAQPFPKSNYTLTVAEVASTVNEVLLTLYLLDTEKDKQRRAYVLNHFLEGFRGTVYRQTLFAEFERKAHEMYEAGTPLTPQVLNDLYYSLISTYYEGAEINDIMKVEWSFIPHFYRSYYVYQYATGFCSAVAIANHIKKTGDASAYLKFLTTGGSDYPIEELKIAGVDLTKPDTVTDALKLFDESIEELAQLI